MQKETIPHPRAPDQPYICVLGVHVYKSKIDFHEFFKIDVLVFCVEFDSILMHNSYQATMLDKIDGKPRPSTPPPPQKKKKKNRDRKMARFFPSGGFILGLGGWGFAVPFYSVQDCSYCYVTGLCIITLWPSPCKKY